MDEKLIGLFNADVCKGWFFFGCAWGILVIDLGIIWKKVGELRCAMIIFY